MHGPEVAFDCLGAEAGPATVDTLKVLIHHGRAGAERVQGRPVLGLQLEQLDNVQVMFAIIVATAETLHAHGKTTVQSAAQAAVALKPFTGHFASVIFALGFIGSGLLAVPVLAGSGSVGTAGLLTDSRRMALATPQNVIIGSISFLNIDDGAPPCDPIHSRTWKDAHGTRAPMRMATRTVELAAVLSSGRIRNRETVRAVVVFGGRLFCTELVPAIAATGNRNTATWTPTSVYERSLAAGTDHSQVVSDAELHYVARPTS